MPIDWGQAWQISLIGFGLVFVVLIVLALAMWLAGLIIGRGVASKGETAGREETGYTD